MAEEFSSISKFVDFKPMYGLILVDKDFVKLCLIDFSDHAQSLCTQAIEPEIRPLLHAAFQ